MNVDMNDFLNLLTGAFCGSIATWSVFKTRRVVKLTETFKVGDISATVEAEAETPDKAVAIINRARRVVEACQ